MLDAIEKLKSRCIELLQDNKINSDLLDGLKQENKSLKRKLHELLKIQEI